MSSARYRILDEIRGFALLNMIIYHALWDMVYLFNFRLDWYHSNYSYIWQQGICWTFIFVSGFCYHFGKNKVKRGISLLLISVAISLITLIATPESAVKFGVLTLIGSATLITLFSEKHLKKINPIIGFISNTILFAVTRNVNIGELGFESFHITNLPNSLYKNLFTAYLGFPESTFYSTDYFSIFPWIFLFLSGYFANTTLKNKNLLNIFKTARISPLEILGLYSLPIYVLHQPVIYGVLLVLSKLLPIHN